MVVNREGRSGRYLFEVGAGKGLVATTGPGNRPKLDQPAAPPIIRPFDVPIPRAKDLVARLGVTFAAEIAKGWASSRPGNKGQQKGHAPPRRVILAAGGFGLQLRRIPGYPLCPPV